MLKQRQSIRLKKYDYSQSGLYFITICTENRERLFGNIINGKIVLNNVGNMIQKLWNKITERFNMIKLDEFIIMPNHIHGIVIIVGAGLVPARNNPNRATTRVAPTIIHTIGDIIGAFKSLTTHEYIADVKYNGWRPFDKRLWQRNYYEHIIRNENELTRIRQYIKNNPLLWNKDVNNPTDICLSPLLKNET